MFFLTAYFHLGFLCKSDLRISFLQETIEKFTKLNIEADVIITFLISLRFQEYPKKGELWC